MFELADEPLVPLPLLSVLLLEEELSDFEFDEESEEESFLDLESDLESFLESDSGPSLPVLLPFDLA